MNGMTKTIYMAGYKNRHIISKLCHGIKPVYAICDGLTALKTGFLMMAHKNLTDFTLLEFLTNLCLSTAPSCFFQPHLTCGSSSSTAQWNSTVAPSSAVISSGYFVISGTSENTREPSLRMRQTETITCKGMFNFSCHVKPWDPCASIAGEWKEYEAMSLNYCL